MTEPQIAILAGGCFWCLEAVYEQIRGVSSVESGYLGGQTESPSYESICSGTTGHAEAVRIYFDPEVVSYRELLEVFFVIHDPTQFNRQGHDVGTQYRSAIYWRDEAQRDGAQAMLDELDANSVFGAPIVTELTAAPHFYRAEEFHQHYFQRNSQQPYCAGVVAPKLHKFREKFVHLRKAD